MSESKIVYPYVPNSVPEIKAQMLKEVGAEDIMDLYEEIPEHLKFKGKLNLTEPILDEYSIRRHVEGLLNKNANCSEYLNFLGAGCAQHFVPAVCDEINGRGEFLTAYVGEPLLQSSGRIMPTGVTKIGMRSLPRCFPTLVMPQRL
jgi:glycine dehydrogenase subunit 1